MKPGPKSDALLLSHMQECIARIGEYAGGDRDRFASSPLVQDAVIRKLQTLTESSQRLSDAIKATETQIRWDALGGFRNVVVHAYLGIDLDVVWSVVEKDLPDLGAALERMRARLALKH